MSDINSELVKLNAMLEELVRNSSEQRRLLADIDKVVRLGNGKPPLTERVAILEDNVKENRTVIAKMFAVWGTIITTATTALSAYINGS